MGSGPTVVCIKNMYFLQCNNMVLLQIYFSIPLISKYTNTVLKHTS